MSVKENGMFKGKVAFVTGAGTGIGRATALAFAQEGASVVVTGHHLENVQETADLIEKEGGRTLAVKCDVLKSEDVQAALNKTIETFGRLDYACNNAGIDHGPELLADVAEEEFERIVNTNLRGVFFCMKYEIPLILKQGGAIVNIASGAGVKGFPGGAYVASKHGVVGLTKSAAIEYANTNLRINAVCPGITDTPMMARVTGGTKEGYAKVIAQEPVGRMGRPEELAAAVIWQCSDAASFAIGQIMVVDGAQTA